MIVKSRSSAGTEWVTYHSSLGNTQYVSLDSTAASVTSISAWNNTSPTSSVFTIAAYSNGTSSNYVAYCWTPIAGFSAFGSYTGNGSTSGPFVYCGFQPKFILVKSSSTGGAGYHWLMQDSSRSPYNQVNNTLRADMSNAENTDEFGSAFNPVAFLSNGFQIQNSGGSQNGNGVTYIYAAFASNPFRNSLAF
jgi:hypothetical protein